MCSLCSIMMVPIEFLLSLFILALSYLFLVSQMAVMFMVRYIEYYLSKAFKPKVTP